MNFANNKDNYIKIIVLGESSTGKTNLINVYLDKKFDPSSPVTLN